MSGSTPDPFGPSGVPGVTAYDAHAVIHGEADADRVFGVDSTRSGIQSVEQASSEAKGPFAREQADPGARPLDEGVRSAAPAEQTWIVYEANGGENGHTDRVYGPYHDRKQAGRVASYINTFTQILGRAWVLPLRPPSEGPDPLGDPHA